jgi:ferredoxin
MKAFMIILKYALGCISLSDAFIPLILKTSNPISSTTRFSSSWNPEDDWSQLSIENKSIDSSKIYNIDQVTNAAMQMVNKDHAVSEQMSEEELYISEAVDQIHGAIIDHLSPYLYDTDDKIEGVKLETFLDEMGREIALLVRCNERPENLLVSSGKAIPNLSHEEKYDPLQLIQASDSMSENSVNSVKGFIPTSFFVKSIKSIFSEHAIEDRTKHTSKEEQVLDRNAVASWFSKSTGEKVVPYDRKVSEIISKYGYYGSGYLTENQFLKLYMEAATLELPSASNHLRNPEKERKLDGSYISLIWRDLEKHGIQPPKAEEREMKQNAINDVINFSKDKLIVPPYHGNFVDECEILEWKEDEHSTPRNSSVSAMPGAALGTIKSSHELVELVSDNNTPKRLRDGDFTFIDEESCIGCTLCASISPSTFRMLDNGRARAFHQDNLPEIDIAVDVCPVSVIHKVSYRELKEFEIARDVNAEDNRYSGHSGHIPIHVARRESDVNRRTSVYHTLKQDCAKKSCPQRGCYDCPIYAKSGDNPFFQENHRRAESIRASDFIKSGEASKYRKVEDL